MTAAPLKEDSIEIHELHEAIALRGQMTAAPLKGSGEDQVPAFAFHLSAVK